METDFESHVQHSFDSYCRTVIRNKAMDIKRQHDRIRERQISLSEVNQDDAGALRYFDKNISNSETFFINGMPVIVEGMQLVEAINKLPEDLKQIILFFYFVGLNDREIGKYFGTSAGSLWSRRKKAEKLLRYYLGE